MLSSVLGILLTAPTGLCCEKSQTEQGFQTKNAIRHSVHTVLQTGEKGNQRQGDVICYLAITHLTRVILFMELFPVALIPCCIGISLVPRNVK